jgi:superfamily II DNA/RNA helicase
MPKDCEEGMVITLYKKEMQIIIFTILSALCWTERRQTMLFSATTTQKTEALARLAVKKEPVYVGVDDETDKATVEGLEQGL